MNIKQLLCITMLFGVALPAAAGHRDHDDDRVSVIFHTPYTSVHYQNFSPYAHGHHGHRHGRGCGHYWDGRYWGRPVPYYYRGHHYNGHHNKHGYHHKKDHWRRSDHRYDNHQDRRGGDHHNRSDNRYDDDNRGHHERQRGDDWGNRGDRNRGDRGNHDRGRD